MTDRKAFLEAIAEQPDDDAPRLVFADWLDDHGDHQRAELIRVQCELPRLRADDPRRAELARREDELLTAHGQRWAAALPGDAEHWSQRSPQGEWRWRRGFPREAECPAQEFVERAEEVLHNDVLQDWTITLNLDYDRPDVEDDGWVERLAASPRLRLVRKVDGPDSGFGPRRFAILMRSPHLTGLRDIDLFEDTIGLEGVRALVEAPCPFRLERLCLNGAINIYADEETPDAVEAVRLLASSPKLAGLEYLGLYYNGLGEGAVAALVASPYLSRSLLLEFEEGDELPGHLADALRGRFERCSV